jgi:hypothetical protein
MNLALLSIPTVLAASLVACAGTDDKTAESNWRDAIVANPAGDDGCFHAAYPEMAWQPVACTTAANRPFASRGPTQFTVGNGDDFALQTTDLIAKASATFVKATGVKTETDSGTKNDYSLQLNSNFMAGTAACKGVAGCLSWTQFIYSTSEASAFMQDWLIGIGNTCPSSSFFSDGQGDCFINSAAVSVQELAVTDLTELKMSGGATTGGKDSLAFAVGTEAFTTSQKDTITDLSTAWNGAEYNIVGDGGGTEAVFNKGASIEIRIGVDDHSTTAPKCIANGGTTGETNNLTLGKCKATSGSEPAIEFTESD